MFVGGWEGGGILPSWGCVLSPGFVVVLPGAQGDGTMSLDTMMVVAVSFLAAICFFFFFF